MIEISEEEIKKIDVFAKYMYYDSNQHTTLIRDDAPQEAKDAFYAYREKHRNDPDDEEY